jgi:outer membrane protein TolC
LLRLEKDTNGITALLRDEVERREKHQLRVRKLAESGNISANQVADAEFCVLRARLSLARQTNDQELKNATLKAAIAIEEEKLRSMADAASKGHISIAAIAAQKLRIARIIAEEQIIAP